MTDKTPSVITPDVESIILGINARESLRVAREHLQRSDARMRRVLLQLVPDCDTLGTNQEAEAM